MFNNFDFIAMTNRERPTSRTAFSRTTWAAGSLLVAGATLVALLWLLGSTSPVVRAAVITDVDTLADDLANNTNCTLREAIQAANTDAVVDQCTAGSGADTIILGSGTYSLSIAGENNDDNATGDLDITESLTITGLGPDQTIIDADGLDRIFDIQFGVSTVVISGVKVYNGHINWGSGGGIQNSWSADLTLINVTVLSNTVDVGPVGRGGGIYHYGGNLTLIDTAVLSNTANGYGGGIYASQGRLALSETLISGNVATGQTGEKGGGGLYLRAISATLTGVEIVGNATEYKGAGVYLYEGAVLTQTGDLLIAHNTADDIGGGIYVGGSQATLAQAQIVSNTAGHGGGVCVNGGSVTLSGTHVISNHASVNGGGLMVFVGRARLHKTQILSNTANGYGGGIYNADESSVEATTIVGNRVTGDGAGIYNVQAITVTNSTISGNHAPEPGGDGGGVTDGGGTTVLIYTTVVSNTADRCGGAICTYGGGSVRLQNTLLAHNLVKGVITNCNTAMISDGNNLEDRDTCALTATNDITGTSALVGPLTQDGNTWIHPLLPSSPAIDEGLCLPGITVDQRGMSRPQGAECDIGAYEATWHEVFVPLVLRNG